MFFTDFQSWIEHRRTGFPTLPKGQGLHNDGVMPTRLKYPVNVQTLNRENYQKAVEQMGGDDNENKSLVEQIIKTMNNRFLNYISFSIDACNVVFV